MLTVLALLAFAGNSLLCRAALARGHADPSAFTLLRLLTGAASLCALSWWANRQTSQDRVVIGGNWPAAIALFLYAAGFSWAYLRLGTGTGALLLFGAVQITMIGHGLWRGDRLAQRQWIGVTLASGGLLWLLLPGLSAPPLDASLLMLGAGVAWGAYSLLGRGQRAPLASSAGNFLRAVPLGFAFLALSWLWPQMPRPRLDTTGTLAASLSGALTSGVGYAVWYAVLPRLPAASAAVVQLSVPILAALGGLALLAELPDGRWLTAALAVLGGIALVMLRGRARS